ncbi:MAG: hypothetical protein KA004_02580 [Verrucomicrobiales bacterium]|nr:hypothetical protein [Verrucomicrobiales bacterium]
MKLLSLLSAALLASPFATTASPLSDLAAQFGVEWMLGTWTDASGEAIVLTYEWRLEKNAIALKLKAPDNEAEGMTVLQPGTDQIHYVSVDSKGGIAKGNWFEHAGNPALRVTYVNPEGESKTMVVEHVKVDADTMKVKLYNGEDPDTAEAHEIELKRKK